MNRDKVYGTVLSAIVNFYCDIFGFKAETLKNRRIMPNTITQGYNSITLILLK